MRHPSRWSKLALTVSLVIVGLAAGVAQSTRPVASFSALAVSLGAATGQATLPVDIQVTRWSSAAEREQFLATLLELGPARLLAVLRKMPSVGRFSTPGSTGYDLRYAVESSAGGTQRIMLLTDRPVGFWEASSGNRTLDYPFTVIELRVRPGGQGDGTVAVAAKISVDRVTKAISFEDYSISPVLLQGLKRDAR